MYYLNLQLFGEGGEGGASTGAEGASSTGVTSESGTEVTTESGKETVTEDRTAQYAKFKEEYKEEFQKDFDSKFGKRFKEHKQTEEKLRNVESDLAPLYKMFKVDNSSDLLNAIISNPSTYANEAYETGTDAELLAARNMLEVERSKRKEEDDRKKAAEAEKTRVEAISSQLKKWNEEGNKVKELHPEFDLRTEMSNPAFGQMLKDGVPMLSIYRALHHDDIAKAIEDKAKKATTELIRNGNGRPSEVGADSTKAVSADMDVNSLTGDDIDKILERVRMGEKISFAP